MKIFQNLIGHIGDESIYQFQLENDNMVRVTLLSYGGTITEIALPYQKIGQQNIVLSLEHWNDYIENPLYVGANLGPNAGRIRDGKLAIGDHIYELSKNDGNNNLHGGFSPISYANWILDKSLQSKNSVSLTLTTFLKDGQDGFPGNRQIFATYILDNFDRLTIQYQGTTDKDTYFNLSNHSYFNLSSDFTHSGLEQILTIKSDFYLENDKQHLPVRYLSVSNSPFDFRVPISMKEQINNFPNHPQLANSKGYNNGYDISSISLNHPAVSLKNFKETKELRIYTDAPCLVLYSGGYIENNYKLKQGRSSASCAVALEAQDFPNNFPHKDYPMQLTKKGEFYHRTIIYELLYSKNEYVKFK